MFNKRISISILLILPFLGNAQQQDTIPLSQILEEVQITGVNAGEKTPVSYTNISESEIEIEFGREEDLHHYEITPYNYKPQVAKKITPEMHYDLGQGLMDQIYDLEMSMDKENGSKKISLRKRKK